MEPLVSENARHGFGGNKPRLMESLVMPPETIVVQMVPLYMKLRETAQYTGMVALVSIIVSEAYESGSVTAVSCLMLLGAFPLVALAAWLIRRLEATEVNLKHFEIVALTVYTVFQAISCGTFAQYGTPLQRLIATFGCPIYIAPQLYRKSSVYAYMVYHFAVCIFVYKVPADELITLVATSLMFSNVLSFMRDLLDAARAIEDEVAANRRALKENLAACDQMHQQWWTLLEKAFDGVIQLDQHGMMHYANEKFTELFPNLEPYSYFSTAFSDEDLGRVEQLLANNYCAHDDESPRKDSGKDSSDSSSSRLLLVGRGAPGWEFDCEIVNAARGASNLTVIGVRRLGESRQIGEKHVSPKIAMDVQRELDVANTLSWSGTLNSQGNSSGLGRRRKRKLMCSEAVRDVATQTSSKPPNLGPVELSTSDSSRNPKAKPCIRPARRKNSWLVPCRVNLQASTRTLLQFPATPASTIVMCLSSVMCSLNVEGKGCCPFHTTIVSMLRGIQRMAEASCVPQFSPSDGWQCPSCFAMHEISEESEDDGEGGKAGGLQECSFCGSIFASSASRDALDAEECPWQETEDKTSSRDRMDFSGRSDAESEDIATWKAAD